MKKFNSLFLKVNYFNSYHLKILLKDLFRLKYKVYSNEFHLDKAISWLIYAKNKTSNGGISLGYSLISGWKPSYPETSGYIIPTIFNYIRSSKNRIHYKICKDIANWLIDLQLKNGSFPEGTINEKPKPSIFNTGQIIFGLISSYEEFEESRFLVSLIKAGDFLVKYQEKNGNWVKYCYQNISHTYNIRTAWALLKLYNITDKEYYKESAIRNINWAIQQINENFWFKNNIHSAFENPILHFIAYTIEGFLECGIILKNEKITNIALNSAKKLLDYYEYYGILPASFDSDWNSYDTYSCLTGDAQISIIWLKLYEIFKEKRFLVNAIKLNNFLKSTQINENNFKAIDGAIKGSDPIWGNYLTFTFPNWAVKFFCDALLLEKKILNL